MIWLKWSLYEYTLFCPVLFITEIGVTCDAVLEVTIIFSKTYKKIVFCYWFIFCKNHNFCTIVIFISSSSPYFACLFVGFFYDTSRKHHRQLTLSVSGTLIHRKQTTKIRLQMIIQNLISMQYIEDIQMFLMNMAFISPSEVENIYIS